MSKAHIDFETFSECDIKSHGAWNYSLHSSTEILCMAYAIDDGPVRLWKPGYEFPADLAGVVSTNGEIYAHNAAFEIAIWTNIGHKLGWPKVADHQWHCTAAQAAYNGLPRKLSKACEALELGDKAKSDEGHKAMLVVSKPRRHKTEKRWTPQNAPEKFARLYSYCAQDVVAEREIHRVCQPLPDREQAIWLLDQRINRRGVPIDVSLCQGAVDIIAELHEDATKTAQHILGDENATPNQVAAIVQFMKDSGVKRRDNSLLNLQAETVEELLGQTELPDDVRQLLMARQTISLASVKKYQAALNWTNSTNRCYDQFKYGGAVTLRWAASGVQFHNLKRSKPPSEEVFSAIKTGEKQRVGKYGEPVQVLSQAARGLVCAPPGKKLASPDYASIEARITHWLADDYETLQAFRDGADLYIDFAAKHVYHVPPEEIKAEYDANGKSERRSVGKAAILGLGFGMGWKKFGATLLQQLGKEFPEETLRNVVGAYRSAYPAVSDIRKRMQRAAIQCVQTGKTFCDTHWTFSKHKNWLLFTLPTGRTVFYFNPRIEEGTYGPEVVTDGPRGRSTLSPSVLVENCAQATARDIEAAAMLRLDAAGFDLVGHVHDSIILEIDEDDDTSANIALAIMEIEPQELKGLPISVSNTFSKRFQ